MRFRVTSDGMLHGPGFTMRCALGETGVIAAADKREGDNRTPLGVWPIRRVLYRPDRLPRPETALPVERLSPDDGWCDAPGDPAYNRPVKLPYAASAEEMWREDGAYDVVVVLGHNDDPVVAGMGSAIFWHCAKPGYPPTAGCVAVARDDMLKALKAAQPGDEMEIVQV